MFREEVGTIDERQALVARAKISRLFFCCFGLKDPTNHIVHGCKRIDEDMNSEETCGIKASMQRDALRGKAYFGET